jgi:putative ABC transport system permease protein
MVLAAVAGIGLVAGIVGVPLGVIAHHYVVPEMGNAVGTAIPSADIAVYHLPELLVLAVGGLIISLAGAALPAVWAARTRTQNALRTE